MTKFCILIAKWLRESIIAMQLVTIPFWDRLTQLQILWKWIIRALQVIVNSRVGLFIDHKIVGSNASTFFYAKKLYAHFWKHSKEIRSRHEWNCNIVSKCNVWKYPWLSPSNQGIFEVYNAWSYGREPFVYPYKHNIWRFSNMKNMTLTLLHNNMTAQHRCTLYK